MKPKLCASDVMAIRARYAAGEGAPSIARDYDVDRTAVWSAATGRTWRHLPMPDLSHRVLRPALLFGDANTLHREPHRAVRGSRHHNAKLDEKSVRRARESHRGGASVVSLARKHGVANKTMRAAIRGATWAHVDQ